ncbi:MAG: DUF6249 domain-containing protein [Alphaproteobacteria bacterium]|nr:DUF6249 domain-containing protein [Alphaproteobacteria bacterium]
MQAEIFIPIVFFGSLVLIVWLVLMFSSRKRAEAFQTLRLAIEKGQEITPAAMDAMARLGHPLADLRRGIVFLALALAVGALAGIVGSEEPDAIRPMLGIAVFPLFLGLAFLGLHIFASDKKSV